MFIDKILFRYLRGEIFLDLLFGPYTLISSNDDLQFKRINIYFRVVYYHVRTVRLNYHIKKKNNNNNRHKKKKNTNNFLAIFRRHATTQQ